MQENGPKNLGFFGTRNMGFLHQNLIEVLSYAMVLTVSLYCPRRLSAMSEPCTLTTSPGGLQHVPGSRAPQLPYQESLEQSPI